MNRIITISNLTIDLSRIKVVKLNNYNDLGKTNLLIVEYNSRFEYVKNPFTEEIEKNMITDQITKEFPNFETAQIYQKEIEEGTYPFNG